VGQGVALQSCIDTDNTAYTSFSKQPVIGYWEILAPIIGLVCIAYGWRTANDHTEQLRLIGTQALHWLAFLVVMNLLLLPGVQRVFSSGATGLAVFTLLTLGTFTAGVVGSVEGGPCLVLALP